MNSSSVVSVDIDVLKKEAEKILTISNEISKLFEDIENIESQIPSQQIWYGKSFEYFDKNLKSITDSFEDVSACLYATARFLDNAADMYFERRKSFNK